jgi:hypothetical protein
MANPPKTPQQNPAVVDAEAPELGGVGEGWLLGPPFALAADVELLQEEPGCFATVRCDACGQAFKVRLLLPGVKPCPKCGRRYTHALLFCPADDCELVADALVQIAAANGYGVVRVDNPEATAVPDSGDDDDDLAGDDDDDDDLAGDDDDDDGEE